MTILTESAQHWLRTFARAVRDRDFAAGRTLFAKDVISYGTVCRRADNLEQLEGLQWRAVWPVTEGFEFDYESARGEVGGDGITIIAEWSSTGFDPERRPRLRRGRSTILLRQFPEGLRAVHTHFSMNPA
jgi:ketosteroid isomerase-like protein